MVESKLSGVLRRFQQEIVDEWVAEQITSTKLAKSHAGHELRATCEELLALLAHATQEVSLAELATVELKELRGMLERLSVSRGEQGYSPSETATLVFSLKKPLFMRLRRELEGNASVLFEELWATTQLLDKLGLFVTEAYQRGREQVITRQQSEMLELSTPAVKLWDGVLALPLIGTLDSARAQTVMETLLQRVVETGSEVVIIDITGVPTVDTLVAQHLMKTVAAARLMGVDCIISGIRPQIAQTIVHLGVELGSVVTKASLADAFRLAVARRGVVLKSAQEVAGRHG